MIRSFSEYVKSLNKKYKQKDLKVIEAMYMHYVVKKASEELGNVLKNAKKRTKDIGEAQGKKSKQVSSSAAAVTKQCNA